MRAGAVATLCMLGAAGAASAQDGPSFDCAAAESQAEKLVCGDDEFAELDREVVRLFRLASDGPDLTAAQRDELAAFQRGWIKGRDDCWKDDDPAACVKRSYVIRIAELRQRYAGARAEDAAGISLGPFATRCTGLDAVIATVFVNSDPGAVYLAWADNVAVLDHVISGSGARYEATLGAGHYLFWNKGDTALFEAPGIEGTLNCTLDEAG